MASPIRQRWLALIAVPLVTAVLWPAASDAAENHSNLIARHAAGPSSTLETRFVRARPTHSFVLVVTAPSQGQLEFSWSVHCFNPAHKERGGATGEATVANGHWVKRIRADWIKHPSYCSGSVEGAAGSSPVLVRVFAY